MRNYASVEIDRPIEMVFRLANDHLTDWSLTVVEEIVVIEKPGHVGTALKIITDDQGRKIEFDGVVTEYQEPTLSAIHLSNKSMEITSELRFEDLGGRTKVTQDSTVVGRGLSKVFLATIGLFLGKSGCRESENELLSLKKFCEEREPEDQSAQVLVPS